MEVHILSIQHPSREAHRFFKQLVEKGYEVSWFNCPMMMTEQDGETNKHIADEFNDSDDPTHFNKLSNSNEFKERASQEERQTNESHCCDPQLSKLSNFDKQIIAATLKSKLQLLLVEMVSAEHLPEGWAELIEALHLEIPVIAVLEERSTKQLVRAFSLGVADVVDRSVPIQELVARIENQLKLFAKMSDGKSNEIVYEDLCIDLRSRKVFREGELIKLTPKEYQLLFYLTKNANIVCHREEILQEVWGYDFETGTNVVDVYVRHLRKKIDRGRARKLIHTIRGSGYMLQ